MSPCPDTPRCAYCGRVEDIAYAADYSLLAEPDGTLVCDDCDRERPRESAPTNPTCSPAVWLCSAGHRTG